MSADPRQASDGSAFLTCPRCRSGDPRKTGKKMDCDSDLLGTGWSAEERLHRAACLLYLPPSLLLRLAQEREEQLALPDGASPPRILSGDDDAFAAQMQRDFDFAISRA